MTTLSDLKTRIADELTRDDMGVGGEAETALDRAIDSAVAFYASEIAWFNHLLGTTSTVAATATATLPTGMRWASQVSYLGSPLNKVDLAKIESLTETGIPSRWAMNGSLIQLWPIPDAIYSLSVQGIADFGAATFPVEHYDLIAARAKVILCRFPFRDTEGLALAQQEEAEALSRVRRESRLRRQSPLRAGFDGIGYNINTDR